MNEWNREDLATAGYDAGQIEKINEFLTYMCEAAHVYVMNIFVRCRRKCSFEQIMAACQIAWDQVWVSQPSQCCGDVDSISLGAKNWRTFSGVYSYLGMGCPKTL